MKLSLILLLIAAPVFAAVDGTVINQTSGQPQANVIITLVQPGQGGMQTLGSVKSDTQGKFKIDKPTGEGPALLQAIYGGVTYTKMLAPGTPSTGVEVTVYDASTKAESGLLNQHVIILQPSESGVQVSEMYLLRNTGKTTFNDPSRGTLQFFVPPGHGKVAVSVSAPGGMPVQREATSANAPNTMKVDYPVRPGETRFDVNYPLETKDGQFAGHNLMPGGETRIVVPNGVTLEGEGLEELGTEPQTKAKIFGVKTQAYSVKISGVGKIAMEATGGGEAGGAPAAEEDLGKPEIKQSMPRIYDKLYWVLALSAAVLALGFAVLYRSRKA